MASSYKFVNKTINRGDASGKTEVFLSDIHFPYHSKHAWEIALRVIKQIKPEIITLGGDIVDHKSVSRHPKALVDKASFSYDVEQTRRELVRLRKVAPNAQIIAKEGNHDQFLASYIDRQAEELGGLDELSFPYLYWLDKLGIEWVEAGTREKIGKLWRLHGHEVGASGSKPAEKMYKALRASVIFGHFHKFDSYLERDYNGELHGAWANGCLYTENPEYQHHTSWTQGFSIVRYVRGGFFEVQQVYIHQDGGTAFAVYNGRVFEAEVR